MINKIGVINSSANAHKNYNTNTNRQIFLEKTNSDTFSANNKQQKTNLSFKSRIKADPEFTASALCFASALISPVAGEIFLTPLIFAFLIPIVGKLVRK